MQRCVNWPRIIEGLKQHGPIDAFALSYLVYLNPRTVRVNLNRMHNEDMVHISSWIRRNGPGPYVPVWTLGEGTDAVCPKPMKSAVKKNRQRARLTVSQREALLQKRRIVKPDPAAAWFSGK